MDRLLDAGRDRSITDGPYGVAGSGRETTLTVKGLEGNHGDPATGGKAPTCGPPRCTVPSPTSPGTPPASPRCRGGRDDDCQRCRRRCPVAGAGQRPGPVSYTH